MNNTLTAEQKKAVVDMAAELKETVKEIESRFETTQNRYGDYLALISKLNERKPMPMFWGLCLIVAGANSAGVRAAVKLITGDAQ